MRVAALLSGGKDSLLALHVAHMWGWDVTHTVSVVPESLESYMFHVPNINVTPLIAESLGIPHVRVETSGEKEKELEPLEAALAELDIDGFVSGAVASDYQRTRLERIGHRLGVKSFAPLWHKPEKAILDTLVSGGFEVRVVGVFAEGFKEEWLGRRITPATIEHLEILHDGFGVNIAGEGGEYETIVLDAPLMKRRVMVKNAVPVWERDHGYWVIDRAELGRERERGARIIGQEIEM